MENKNNNKNNISVGALDKGNELVDLESGIQEQVATGSIGNAIVRASFSKLWRLAISFGVAIAVIAVAGAGYWFVANRMHITPKPEAASAVTTSLSSSALNKLAGGQLGTSDQLTINGALHINSALIVAPTSTPLNPVVGQVYVNQDDHKLYYYNGQTFSDLLGADGQVNSLAGASGAISLGLGLSLNGQKLTNNGVLSIQGLRGDVSFANVSVSGSTLSIDTASTSTKGLASFNAA